MLGAPTDRLHGCPHIAVARSEVPPGGQKPVRGNAASFVNTLRGSVDAICQHHFPDVIAVSLNHRMCAAEFVSLLRIKRGVDAAVNYPDSPLARQPSNFEAAVGVAGVDSDSNDITGLELVRIKGLQSLVGNDRITIFRWRRRRQNVQPPRRDDANSKRHITRIYQVNRQAYIPLFYSLGKSDCTQAKPRVQPCTMKVSYLPALSFDLCPCAIGRTTRSNVQSLLALFIACLVQYEIQTFMPPGSRSDESEIEALREVLKCIEAH
jgi:hypothetical protein